ADWTKPLRLTFFASPINPPLFLWFNGIESHPLSVLTIVIKNLTGRDGVKLAVVYDGFTVNPYRVNSFRKLVRLFKGGRISDGVRIKKHQVGPITFSDPSPVLETQS